MCKLHQMHRLRQCPRRKNVNLLWRSFLHEMHTYQKPTEPTILSSFWLDYFRNISSERNHRWISYIPYSSLQSHKILDSPSMAVKTGQPCHQVTRSDSTKACPASSNISMGYPNCCLTMGIGCFAPASKLDPLQAGKSKTEIEKDHTLHYIPSNRMHACMHTYIQACIHTYIYSL